MPMTPQQRSDAARKAAATKRRMRAQQWQQAQASPPPRPTAPPPPTSRMFTCPTCGVAFPAGTVHRCQLGAPPPPRPTPPPAAPPPPPPAPSPANGRAFGPKPDLQTLRLHALSAFEDLFVMQTAVSGITPEAREAFADYKKLLKHGLGPVNAQASASQAAGTQNEQGNALRVALIKLVKLTF